MRHSLDDGRGYRLVYLDGVEVERVTEAFESDQGWVTFAKYPFEIDENNQVITHTKHGKVVVKFIGDEEIGE